MKAGSVPMGLGSPNAHGPTKNVRQVPVEKSWFGVSSGGKSAVPWSMGNVRIVLVARKSWWLKQLRWKSWSKMKNNEKHNTFRCWLLGLQDGTIGVGPMQIDWSLEKFGTIRRRVASWEMGMDLHMPTSECWMPNGNPSGLFVPSLCLYTQKPNSWY